MDDIKGWVAFAGLVVSLATAVLGLPYVRRKVAAEAERAKVDASRADLDFTQEMREMARQAVAEIRSETTAKLAAQDAKISSQDQVIVQCGELVDSLRAYALVLLRSWPGCSTLPPPTPPPTIGVRWPLT